ncbi:nucleotide exchange factor GrpE [Candidatus Peregrinibacteria bacterium]|nr:nucleotide exchange factor GrpE [Candidatus Peregrinibacteria bacterium]
MTSKKVKKSKKDVKKGTKEIEKLQAELTEMTELAKRAMADMQNIKRRVEDERSQIIIRANARLFESLLPALDNLDRALKHAPEDNEWCEGITMAIKQIKKSLEESGLAVIPTINETFNPDFHEAVLEVDGEKDKIIEEFEKGYILGDLVLRHAKVSVGKGK